MRINNPGVPRAMMMIMITLKEMVSRGTLPNPTTAVLRGGKERGRREGEGGEREGRKKEEG